MYGRIDSATPATLSSCCLATSISRPPLSWRRATSSRFHQQARPRLRSLTVQYTTPATDSSEEALLAGLLTTVLTNRLTKTIREELGASYSPNAFVAIAPGPAPEATVNISISGAPTDMSAIVVALQANLDDLRTNGSSTEEFSAAVAEANDSFNFISDQQIIAMLERWLAHPNTFVDYQNEPSALAGVSVGDLRVFANQVLPAEHYIEITQLPR